MKWVEYIKRFLSLVLIFYLCISSVPVEVFAEDLDDSGNEVQPNNDDTDPVMPISDDLEEPTLSLAIDIYGSKVSLAAANDVSVAYGDFDISYVSIEGDIPAGYSSCEIFYLNAEGITDPTTAYWNSTPYEVGVYYVGYEIRYPDGTSYYSTDGSYRFTIERAKLSNPTDLSFESGTEATYVPNLKNTKGSALSSSAVSGYRVELYLEEDDSLLDSRDVSASTTSVDFIDTIIARDTYGKYYFKVKALAADTSSYEDSDYVSSEDDTSSYVESDVVDDEGNIITPDVKPVLNSYAYSVLIKTTKPNGVSSVTPTSGASNILIPGSTDASHNSLSIDVTVASTHQFSRWALYAADGTEITTGFSFAESATTRTNILSIASSATNNLIVELKPEVKDTTAPVIKSFTAGTVADGEYGYLIGSAEDVDSGIYAYAFSTKLNSAQILESEWTTLAEPTTETYTTKQNLYLNKASTGGGYYYFYVKDKDGNITRSTNYIPVTKVTVQNYYSDGVLTPITQLAVGSEVVTMPSSGARYGYTFIGWDLNEGDEDFVENEVKTFSATDETDVTIYGKWTRDPIEFSKQPESVEKTYDGDEVTLTVEISNEYVGAISWQWYRVGENSDEAVGEPITGTKSASLTLKNVEDSGQYYVTVTTSLAGADDVVNASEKASVTINKATLNITPKNQSISFGDSPINSLSDENAFTITGLVAEETIDEVFPNANVYFENQDKGISSYVTGDETNGAAGSYEIKLSGAAPTNYTVSFKSGSTLTVNPKDGTLDTNGVSIELTDDSGNEITTMEFDFASATDNKPNISLFDSNIVDGGRELAVTDYAVTVTNNTGAGTALVTVTLKNNYSGTLTTTYELTRKALSASDLTLNISSIKYGEVAYPEVIGNPADNNSTITYYYYEATSSRDTAVTTQPKSVGDYRVYAKIAGGDRYDDVETGSVAFSISKRTIIITSKTTTWQYDGNAHSDMVCTISGDGFASGEGFMDDVIYANATITDVGEVTNTISAASYALGSGTDADNYEISIVEGTLRVTEALLDTPTGLAWSSATSSNIVDTAIATWSKVTNDSVSLAYMVVLYRDGEAISDEIVVTDSEKYDFEALIRADAMEIDRAASYSFKVKTVTTASTSERDNTASNYKASDYSAASGDLSTVRVYFGSDNGAKEILVNDLTAYENTGTYDSPKTGDADGYFYMIAGETAKIVVDAFDDCSFLDVDPIWEIEDSTASYLSILDSPSTTLSNSNRTVTAYLKIENDLSALNSSSLLRMFAHTNDDKPSLTSFSATLSDDRQTITFHIEGADSTKITGWAIGKDISLDNLTEDNTSGQLSATPILNAWNAVPNEPGTDTPMTKHVEIDFSITNDGNSSGTYTAYVTDYSFDGSGGGIAGGSESTIEVYTITFADGADGSLGAMPSILKLEDSAITLPEKTYVRAGYNFKNWKDTDGDTYLDQATYAKNGDNTLTAVWSAKQYIYSVEYYAMDPTTGEYPIIATSTKAYTAVYGKTVSYDAKAIQATRDGYELDTSRAASITVVDNSQVLKVYYKCKEHTFTFKYTDPTDGTVKNYVGTTTTYRVGQPVIAKANIGYVDLEGYSFNGWTCSKVAEWPDTMPDEDLEATGSYTAGEATYYFHFYTQDLTESCDPTTGIAVSSVGDSYTEVYEMSQNGVVYSLVTTHGREITASTTAIGNSSAPEITGFTLAGIKMTNGAAANPNTLTSDEASALSNTITTTANAAVGKEVHFYYYYTRNDYSVTLKVYKDGTGGDELYSHVFENKLYFGTTLSTVDYNYYENYGSESWVSDDYIKTEYDLKADATWSTNGYPATMQAGNIVIERAYVKKNISKYTVRVFKEQTTAGTYLEEPSATFTYYDNEGATITVDDAFISKIKAAFTENSYYEFDAANTTATGGIVPPDDSEEPLVIDLYFKRITTKSTIYYRYVDPATGDYATFGTLVKSGRWDESYDVEALAFFSGQGIGNIADGVYTSEDLTYEGGPVEDYNFLENNFIVSYSGSYYLSGTKTFSYSYDTVAKLTAQKTETYKKTNSKVYVTYQVASAEAASTYYVDLQYDTSYFRASTASTGTYPLTVDLDGDATTTDDIYPIRLRNLCDIYESNYTTAAGDSAYSDYPGLGYTKRSYTYVTDSDGNRIFNPGFSAVSYGGGTYYLEDVGDDGSIDYLCIGVDNTLYQGSAAYFSIWTNSNYPGRAKLTEVYNDYQSTYTEEDDDLITALYIYKGTYNETMKGNSTYTLTFRYHDTSKVTWSLGDVSPYSKTVAYGKAIDPHSVDTIDAFASNTPNGKSIVWYSDTNYTNEVTGDIVITSDTVFYGRYEKEAVDYAEYVYYELSDTLVLDENDRSQDINYITAANIDTLLADEAIGPRITKKEYYIEDESILKANDYYYETEFGGKVYYPINQTAYYLDGTFVMVKTIRKGLTYSSESLDVTDETYLKGAGSGFVFDTSNENNRINAYSQTSGVDLSAYFARTKYSVYTAHDDEDEDGNIITNTTSNTYKYGGTVTVPFPTKNGYWLAGCVIYTSDTGEDGSWTYEGIVQQDGSWYSGAIPADIKILNSVYAEGSTGSSTAPFEYNLYVNEQKMTFTMPGKYIRLEIPWTVSSYTKKIYNFFETASGIYDTETFEKIYAASMGVDGYSVENIELYTHDEVKSGKLYKYGDNIIGASHPGDDGYTNYYNTVSVNSSGIYQVDDTDLIVIENTVTVTEEQVIPLKDEEYCVLYRYQLIEGDSSNFEFSKLIVAKNNISVYIYSDFDNDSFTIKADYQYAFYYSRKSGYEVGAYLKMQPDEETGEIVALPSGTSLLGVGDYKYGNQATLKASLPSGYSLVGWYKASDVLEGYDETTNNDCELLPLVSSLPITALTAGDSDEYNFKVTKSSDYVAVIKAESVDTASLTVTGAKNSFSGDYTVTSDNTLTATISLPTGSSTQVTGYQWYERSGATATPISGATAQTYDFPVKTELGTYIYYCVATLKRSDNGKTGSVTSNEFAITVTPADLSYTVDSYNGIYDKAGHGISVNILEDNPSSFEIYYSADTPLDSANYSVDGQMYCPTYTDVRCDSDGNILSYTIYYYIHHTTYTDAYGSATVTINPRPLTLSRGVNFTKVYDGTAEITGAVYETGTLKNSFVDGGSLVLTGFASDDSVSNIYCDFDASYNSKDVDSASYILVSNLRVGAFVNGSFVESTNYTMSNTSVTVYGSITPLSLTATWDETASFIYDGASHVRAASFDQTSLDSLAAIGEEGLSIEVLGEEEDVGSGYIAHALIDEGEDYVATNYNLSNSKSTFEITKRSIRVIPTDRTLTYDGSYYGLLSDGVSVSGLVEGHTVSYTLGDTLKKDVGSYEMAASNLKVYSDSYKSIDVTSNYDITYEKATLTITPKIVRISGITIKDKVYDGLKTASIANSPRTINGVSGYIVDIVDENGISAAASSDILVLDAAKVTAYFVGADDVAAANVGENKEVKIEISSDALSGSGASNYVLDLDACQTTATASITKASLGLYVMDTTVVYGEDVHIDTDIETEDIVAADLVRCGDDGEYAYEVLQPTGSVTVQLRKCDSQGIVIEDSPYEDFVPGETEAGYYEISIKSYTADFANYYATPAKNADGSDYTALLKVEKRPVAVVKKDSEAGATVSKVFDSSTDATELITSDMYEFTAVDGDSYSGILEKDKASFAMSSLKATYVSKNVSEDVNVVVSNLKFDNDNYEAYNNSFILKGEITKKPLKVTLKGSDIVYGSSPSYSYEIDETDCLTETDAAIYTDLTANGLIYDCDYDISDSTKRDAGTYTVTGHGLDAVLTNYAITYVPTTFEVSKATITVTAKSYPSAGSIIYGETTIPTFEGTVTGAKYTDSDAIDAAISQFVSYKAYDSNGSEIVQGAVASASAGSYDITPIIDTTGADESSIAIKNYTYEAVNGRLTIIKKSISIEGVKVNARGYNETTLIQNETLDQYIDLSEAKITIEDSINGTTIFEGDDIWTYVVESASGNYNYAGASMATSATIKFTLRDAYKDSFTLADVTVPATMNKSMVDVYLCRTCNIKYGGDFSTAYIKTWSKIDYSGSNLGSIGSSYTPAHMRLVDVNDASKVYYSYTGDFPPVGTYDVYMESYYLKRTADRGNYQINYVVGTANVVVSKATFETPVVTWSDTDAATINFNRVADIAQASVEKYQVTLYKVNESTSKLTQIYQTEVLDDGSTSYSVSFEEIIRGEKGGAGAYEASVQALPSTDDASNVNKSSASYAKLSDSSLKIYAALVSADYATDAVTSLGKSTDADAITINGQAGEYLMVDMEKDVPIAIKTKNATGYRIDSWTCLAGDAVDENFVSTSPTQDATTGTISTQFNTLTHISSSTKRVGTVVLAASSATFAATFKTKTPNSGYEETTDKTLDFNYNAENTASFKVDLAPAEGDNSTVSNYTYSYEWFYRINTRATAVSFGSDTTEVSLPVGLGAGSTYLVGCTITATRLDNGASVTRTEYVKNFTGSVALKIKRAYLVTATAMSKTSWVYGQTRGVPGISNNPDNNTNIVYEYSDTNSDEATWQTTMLTDVGTHYVRAKVAESDNYEEAITEPISYTISQATLPTIDEEDMSWAESENGIYGLIKFKSVDSLIPIENANDGGVSDLTISYKYLITLSRKENQQATEWTVIDTKTLEPSDITDGEYCTYDYYSLITSRGTGTYRYSVQVVVDSSDSKSLLNCSDSSTSTNKEEENLDVYAFAYANTDSSKTASSTVAYGESIYLTIESPNNLVDIAAASKQWYCTSATATNVLVSGATSDTLSLRDISESGTYTCKLTYGGIDYYTTPASVTINKRGISLTSPSASKEYDGTALSDSSYTIKNDDNSSWSLVAGASKENTYSIPYANGTEEYLVFDDTVELTEVSESPKTNSISGVKIYSDSTLTSEVTSCYDITISEGTLTMDARELAKVSGVITDDEAGIRDGILLSNKDWPSAFIYDAVDYCPEVIVSDIGLASVSSYALVEGDDYEISYSDNYYASSSEGGSIARITITGVGNYTGTITRTFEIGKRPLDITSRSRTKTYDGVALTNSDATVTGDGYILGSGTSFAPGDYPVFNFTGSQTITGSSDNTYTFEILTRARGTGVTSNYDITMHYGSLSVEKATGAISFTMDGTEILAEKALNKVYDKTAVPATAPASWYEDNGALDLRIVTTSYYRVDSDGETLLSQAPYEAGSYKLKLSAEESANYTSATAEIAFTIEKRPVIFTAVDQSSKYNEEIVDNIGTTFENLILSDYDSFTIAAATTAKKGDSVGNYPINLELLTTDDNYEVTLVSGVYTIVEEDMTLSEYVFDVKDGGSIVYDAESHTALEVRPEATMYQSGDASDEIVVYYSDTTELTTENYSSIGITTPIEYKNAGQHTIYYYVHSGANGAVGNYKDTSGSVVVEIEKADQEIAYSMAEEISDNNGTLTMEYDGNPFDYYLNPYVKSAYTDDTGATISVKYEGTDGSTVDKLGVMAGSYKITITADATENYKAVTASKNFEITKTSCDVWIDNFSHTYDGGYASSSEGTLEYDGISYYDDLYANADISSFLDVGNYKINIYGAKIVHYLKLVYPNGQEAESWEYAYYKSSALLETMTASDGTLIYYLDRTNCYNVNYLDSYYEVTPATATISLSVPASDLAKYFNRTYDRTAVPQSFSKSWYSYTGDGTVSPVYYEIASDGTMTEMTSYPMNAGKYAVKLVASGRTKTTDSNGKVTYTGSGNYYTCESNLMTFEISKRSITIRANDGTSTYRSALSSVATPSVISGSICTGDASSLGLATKVVVDTTTMVPVTYASNVGSYVTVPTYVANSNYDISIETGTYTITKATMTVTASAGYSGTYDGDSHKAFTLNVPVLSDNDLDKYRVYYRSTPMTTADHTVGTSASCEITEAGTYTFYYYIEFDNYEDVYSTEPIVATISSSAQRLELMVDESSLVFDYDGNSHGLGVSDVVAYSPDSTGFEAVDETGATITYEYVKADAAGNYSSTPISGDPIDAGTYRVTATASATGSYASAIKRFYITINKLPLEITTESASKVFDGTALTNSGYSLTDGNLLTGESLDSVTFSGTQTNVGSSDNTIKSVKILNSIGKDCSDNYDISYKLGTLTVTQATPMISITSVSSIFNKTYDGSSISVADDTWMPLVSYTGDNRVANVASLSYYRVVGDGAAKTYEQLSSAPTNAGKYALKVLASATRNYAAAESDYEEFEIAKAASLSITLTDYEGKYDGRSHEPIDFSIDGLSSGEAYSIYMASTPLTSANYESDGDVNLNISTAGSYDIYYYIHFENYEDIYNVSPETVVISTADQSLVFPNMTVAYTGEPVDLSEAIYAVGEVEGERTGAEITISYAGESTAPSAVGTYRVEVSVEAIADKYNAYSETRTLTIYKPAPVSNSNAGSLADDSSIILMEGNPKLWDMDNSTLGAIGGTDKTDSNVLGLGNEIYELIFGNDFEVDAAGFITAVKKVFLGTIEDVFITSEVESLGNESVDENRGNFTRTTSDFIPVVATSGGVAVLGVGLVHMATYKGGKRLLLRLLKLLSRFKKK